MCLLVEMRVQIKEFQDQVIDLEKAATATASERLHLVSKNVEVDESNSMLEDQISQALADKKSLEDESTVLVRFLFSSHSFLAIISRETTVVLVVPSHNDKAFKSPFILY